MESLTTMAERDNIIMKLLRTTEIRHPIVGTDKGELWLSISKGQAARDYKFILDAVPVDPKVNKELLARFNGVYFTLYE